jgi:hypothetical protein
MAAPCPARALRHRDETIDDPRLPRSARETQVSLALQPKRRGKPGPKGPSQELIAAIVEMKRRNPRFGCRRIAQQPSYAFGIDIDKDVVRRVLAKHYRPEPGSGGPSRLTFLGHAKDSLWSLDLFRCESLFLVHAGDLDGFSVCRMFNEIISGTETLPCYLSSDHDPLFKFRQWQANLRILEVIEVKPIPYMPLSHPFVERLIGTIRRELLDAVPFWTARDLGRKL